MEILAAFIAAAIFARIIMSARRTAIDHELERAEAAWLRPVIDDPTLGPDQVMRMNRRGGDSSSSGWPT